MIEVRQLMLDWGMSYDKIGYRIKKANVKVYKKPRKTGGKPIKYINDSDVCKIKELPKIRPYEKWISLRELADDLYSTADEVAHFARTKGYAHKKVRRHGEKDTIKNCYSPEVAKIITDLFFDLSEYVPPNNNNDKPESNNDWFKNRTRGLYTRIQCDYEIPWR